jgi:hypothetical protein
MIIVKIQGGLGNQLWQYAFARHLAHINNTEVLLDLSALNNPKPGDVPRSLCLDLFNVKYGIATDKLIGCYVRPETGIVNRLINRVRRVFPDSTGYIRQGNDPHEYNVEYLAAGRYAYLDGYWQSYKFFYGIEGIIRREFTLKGSVPMCVARMQQRILGRNSVCLNVRRGDFVGSKYHICYGMDYYRQAMREMSVRVEDPHYYIFTDDIEWCRANFAGIENATIISHGMAGGWFEYYHLLMRSCRHFIIPNSTFGWFAAWLWNLPGKVVIAPRLWYKDSEANRNIAKNLCPSEWILI